MTTNLDTLDPLNADSLAPTRDRLDRLDRLIGAVSRPLDKIRRPLWQLSAKTAFGRACIRDRGLRLTTLGLGHMAVGLALTLLFPVWLLLFGPLLLGIPHVAGDIRYLLIHPPVRLGRLGIVLILTPLALMTLHRMATVFGMPFSAPLEIGFGLLSVAGALIAVRTTWLRRLIGLFALSALTVPLVSNAETSRAAIHVIAHLHNFVAVGLWLFVLRGEVRLSHVVSLVVGYGLIAGFLFSGLGDGLIFAADDIGAFGLGSMTAILAPHVPPDDGLRWVLLYAFAQSFHYAIWIRLIPQRIDTRKSPPTFARSLSRLRRDFGTLGFVFLAVMTLALPLSAVLLDPADVRNAYLVAAIGHGYIEFAVIAALLAQRRTA